MDLSGCEATPGADLLRPDRFINPGSPGNVFGSQEQLEDVARERLAWDTL